jgi:methyl-accepting chemotaxis protein
VLHRIDAMTGTTRRIMAGDLSGRLPVGRSGDELDRLAENLNAMLERIEALREGESEVGSYNDHGRGSPERHLKHAGERYVRRQLGPAAAPPATACRI